MDATTNGKLLELTSQEQRVIEERLGKTVPQAVDILLAALQWAFDNATPQNFKRRFRKFVAAHSLNPALADVAADFVLTFTASDEEQEIDRRGFALMFSKKPDKLDEADELDEADKQTWTAFLESCRKAYEQATPSMKLATQNMIDRDQPTTEQEVEEMQVLAHLREWARSQIQ
jgi:hypothetical protein